jgi:AhpD family alkylhydroperoxidase
MRHESQSRWVPLEEVFDVVGAILGTEILVIAVDGGGEPAQQRVLGIARKKRVPIGPPEYLDDIPAGAGEEAVLLTDAVVNACTWAVAFHTALALKAGLKSVDVQAIREGRSPEDGKLAALSALARKMIETRGRVADPDIDRFIAAGFAKEHALKVIAIVAASTITNYTGSVTKTPLEAAFQEHAWAG